MSIQFSVAVRNAILDAVETAIGVSAKLQIYTGSVPANCAASEVGTKLAEFALASDWAAAASAGAKSFNNTPLATTGLAGGTAAHFRIMDNAGTTCHWQGTVTATGGGGDVTLDNPVIATSQAVNVTSFVLNAPNP